MTHIFNFFFKLGYQVGKLQNSMQGRYKNIQHINIIQYIWCSVTLLENYVYRQTNVKYLR